VSIVIDKLIIFIMEIHTAKDVIKYKKKQIESLNKRSKRFERKSKMVLTKAKSIDKEKRISLDEAIKRKYKVKTFVEKKYNRKHCRIYLPICTEGKEFKLKPVKSKR